MNAPVTNPAFAAHVDDPALKLVFSRASQIGRAKVHVRNAIDAMRLGWDEHAMREMSAALSVLDPGADRETETAIAALEEGWGRG